MDNADIDFKEIIKTLIRKKEFVLINTGIILFLGILFAISQKRVWQGEFQILLSQKTNNSLSNKLPSNLRDNTLVTGILSSKLGNELETEVVILKSPSVLMNVFNYVKNEKEKNGESVENWRYSKWMNKNFNINLEEDTSVLNIRYRDTNKDLIIPVLEKTVNAYKGYSGKDRARSINKGIIFLENQISIYNKKSKQSLDELQTYGNQYDLSAVRIPNKDGNNVRFSINVELERIKAANKIRVINEKIKNLKEYNNKDPEFFLARVRSLSNKIGEIKYDNGIYDDLDKIEKRIATLESILKNKNDEDVKSLLNRKLAIIKLIKNNTFRQLEAEKVNAESNLAATKRPENVIFKYRELLRNAERDTNTLVQLENQYRLISLEKSRIKDPWDLITQPTISKDPVAPQRKRIALASLLGGFFLVSLIAVFIEKTSNNIFQVKDIKNILGNINTTLISKDNENNLIEMLRLFFYRESSKTQESIYFVEVNELPINLSEVFKSTSKLNESLSKFKIIKDLKINDLIKDNNKIELNLIIGLNNLSKIDLINLKQKIDLAEITINNLVIIE